MTPAQEFLAEQLIAQGLAYWASFAERKASGALTQADLDAASVKLDTDLNTLEADVKAQADADLRAGGG